MTSSLLHGAIAALNTGAVAGGTLIAIDIKHAGGQLATTLWNQFAKVAKYAAGCFVFCRKDAFDAVGGFSEKVYASEEIWLARALKQMGKATRAWLCGIGRAHSDVRAQARVAVYIRHV